MNERIQLALDGDLDRKSLTPAECVELVEAEGTIEAVVQAIPVYPVPALGPAVLRRIGRRVEAAPPAARTGMAAWVGRPRASTWPWRPGYAVATALAAGAVLLTATLWPRVREERRADQLVLTRFVLAAPEAGAVALAGDFTDWRPAYAMTRSGPGMWTVVVPLAPGVHSYSFVIDGQRWVPDPMAPAVEDGFGGVNSRLAVLRPDRRS